jgi:tetratricopeptide (TPR) repeat protein
VAAYCNRGSAYLEKKDYDRAIADYDQAVKLDPNDAAAYLGRGSAYLKKGDYDSAYADMEKVLQINPNNADARHALEWLQTYKRSK